VTSRPAAERVRGARARADAPRRAHDARGGAADVDARMSRDRDDARARRASSGVE
jgi:hypothetical protein